MKIEKRKISGEKKLSVATKSSIAAALGMAAAFALSACDDTASAGSEEPLGGPWREPPQAPPPRQGEP